MTQTKMHRWIVKPQIHLTERALIGLDETAVKLDVCKKTVSRLIEDGELGPKVKVRSCAKLFVKNVDAYLEKIRMLAERKYQSV